MKHVAFLPLLLLLAACAEDWRANGGSLSNDPTTENVAPTKDCPVIGSQNWSAWIDAMPPGPAQLHIRGEVVLPTPGYTEIWRLGAADRRLPPGQHMKLSFLPPDGVVAQVITTQDVAYAGDATYPEYRVIFVHCGDEQLVEITEIPVAH